MLLRFCKSITLQSRRATQIGGKKKKKGEVELPVKIGNNFIPISSPAGAGSIGFKFLGSGKLAPHWCPSPHHQAVNVHWIWTGLCWKLAAAFQTAKGQKFKQILNFYLGRVIISTNRKKKEAQNQHWALQYHLDFDRESLLKILKDRKLKTKTTISVLNHNHDYFCKNYACFYKGRIAEDYNFVCYWVRPSIKVVF